MAFLAALPGVISALAPAVATAGAAYMQSSSAAASYRRMNAANANLTFAQQMWEEMMRGSAHQAEVTDLQRAGLNPILSAGGGGGSWHSVNPIPQQPVPAKSVGDVGGTLVNTALALKNVELLEAQRDKTEAEAREVKQRVDENEVGERVQNIREDTRLKNYEYTMRNALAGPQLAKAVQEAGLLEQQYRRGSMTDDKLRQEVANLAQQYKIGESAEEQSRILRDIYKSDPGFLLKLLSVIKDLVK